MAVITPQFNIQIKTQAGKTYRVPAIESIRINTSRSSDPDTATIKLPTMKNLELDTFKKGDELTIWLGHKNSDYGLAKVFLGMVSKVGPNYPLSIEAKDWWWVIKRAWYKDLDGKYPTGNTSASLSDIAQRLIDNPGDGADAFEGVELITSPDYSHVKFYGEFPLGTKSYGEIFGRLLEHGWDLFIISGTKKLYFGPRNILPTITPHQSQFQSRIPIFRSGLNIIESDLNYEDLSGIRQVQVWISGKDRKPKDPDGKYPLDGETPDGWDKNGETKKFDIAGLSKIADFTPDNYARLLYDIHSKRGISGHFRTFGQAFYQHWMKCKLEVTLGGGKKINWHCFPSGIEYIYSSTDGFKMDVNFENTEKAV